MYELDMCWVCHKKIPERKIKIVRLEVEAGYRMVKTCGVCDV
jgi:hypothetical protein